MKIVISSTGPSLKAVVEPRFGRAAFLLLYDTETKAVVEVVDNTHGQDAVQGAGISVAGLLAQKGVEIIFTGRVGPKAMAVVDQAGIRVVDGISGTVEEVIDFFLAAGREGAC
jgi:predicted Fe-Mo cluster-binding NifX family protein